jgi:hypothetical protein
MLTDSDLGLIIMDEDELNRDEYRFMARFRRSWNKQVTITYVTFSLQEKLPNLPLNNPWIPEGRIDMMTSC